jgi:probable HAF family extracellular repeat protein
MSFFLAAGLAAALPAAASPMYRLTPLGSLPGLSNSEAFGINNAGEVTGGAFGRGSASEVPFLYNGTKMMGLGIAQGAGQSINSRGQIAGQASGEAFFYNGSSVTYLGAVPGGRAASNAFGVNDSGEVVGELYGPPTRAFIYNGTRVSDLGSFPGGKFAGAVAINSNGEITGSADVGHGNGHAFVDKGKTMQDIGTLGGGNSSGHSINASGEVTGWSTTKRNAANHAFLYNGTRMIDLGALPGDADSTGAGINDAGDVVGWSGASGAVNHAFLYDSTGMHDLNDLIDSSDPFLLTNPSFILDEATGINDSGQIVGDGFYTPKGSRQQVFEAFILTPESPVAAPEPTALSLVATGMIALFVVRRRKTV